tara:strand:+ start:3440 stop:4153 length:714 start_codon:yes stop_codon:yes gene_type:complete
MLNYHFITENITNNIDKPVAYRWTHGATDKHLGDGLLIYSLIQMLRSKIVVCLGSGGGFIPRLMIQAQCDLVEQQIFDECRKWNETNVFVVDAANEVGGVNDWKEKDSFFRSYFHPRVILDTTENAFHNFFVKEDLKIDYLHIDADHSYEGVKKDFELYSTILNDNGIISIHDTDQSYHDNYIVTDEIKEKDYQSFDGPAKFIKDIPKGWKTFNLFNEGVLKGKPSSTGITLLQKKV